MGLNISNSYFDGNNATRGSAIYKNSRGHLVLNDYVFGKNQAKSSSIVINKVNGKYVITFRGNDNILNAIWNDGQINTVLINGVNPVLGADNSNNGKLLYQDDREFNQTIDVEIYDENDDLLYKNAFSTGIYGEVNISAYAIKKIVASHPNDKLYTGISNSLTINVSVVGQDGESIINQMVDIPVKVYDQFGLITNGTITIKLNNEIYTVNASQSYVTIKSPSKRGIYTLNITYTDPYGNTLTNTSTLKVYHPKMDITKVTLTPLVIRGNYAEFEIIVKNTGDIDLIDVIIVEDSFNGLIYDSYQTSSLWTEITGAKHSWSLNKILTPNETASLFVKFKTDEIGKFTNNVISSSRESFSFTQLDNVSANANVEVISNLALEKYTLTDRVYENDTVEFLITVTNIGNTVISNVFVEDSDFSQFLEFIGWTSQNGNWTFDKNNMKWHLADDLQSGESASIIVKFKALHTGELRNNATAGINNQIIAYSYNTTEVLHHHNNNNTVGNGTHNNTNDDDITVIENPDTPDDPDDPGTPDDPTTPVDPDTPEDSKDRESKSTSHSSGYSDSHATGNPIIVLLLALLSLVLIRRKD